VQRSKGPRQPSRRKSEETELRATVATAPEPSSDDTRLAAQAYDDFPYEGYSFPLTHPERLATIAALFGMQPPPVATARVLELGCGTGGNLIPRGIRDVLRMEQYMDFIRNRTFRSTLLCHKESESGGGVAARK
jgi:hypothetical protein